jgi:hypothetical protein
MATDWVVTTATERIPLDAQKRGEATFTVTNPNGHTDVAVFDVVPGDGADRAWFTVDEPQRLVRGNTSVAYLLKVAVGAGAPPGGYTLQGRVYSADSAPEETSVLSGRVKLDIEPEPVPVRQRFPWWMVAAAGLLAIVLGVVGWMALAPDGAPPQATVPNLLDRTEIEAVGALRGAGLAVGTIAHRHDTTRRDSITKQSVPAGTAVAAGTAVDLEVAVALVAPGPTTPAHEASFTTTGPPLVWSSPQPFVTKWVVRVNEEVCKVAVYSGPTVCRWEQVDMQFTTAPRLEAPQLSFLYHVTTIGWPGQWHTGRVQWQVFAVDDFGVAGPPSPLRVYKVNP